MGRFCETPICYPACLHNGRCVAPGLCDCVGGYIGDFCEGGKLNGKYLLTSIRILYSNSLSYRDSYFTSSFYRARRKRVQRSIHSFVNDPEIMMMFFIVSTFLNYLK